MGQRANLIVKSEGKVEIYYTHHRANTLDKDLFWGPQYALGFIRSQQKLTNEELLDEIWAEGGAVMDCDQKKLLWFGGEDVTSDVPLRRVHQSLMRHLWAGWQIEWAYEGVADIARETGRSNGEVLCDRAFDPLNLEQIFHPKHPLTTVITLQVMDQVASIKFPYQVGHLAMQGPALAEKLQRAEDQWRLWDGNCTWFPSGGLYIDISRCELSMWTASYFPLAVQRLTGLWQGWSIRWLKDGFEYQKDRAGATVVFPNLDEDQLIGARRATLLRPEVNDSGADMTVQIAEMLSAEKGIRSINVNPLALQDAQLHLPLQLRTQLFDEAARSLRERSK